MKLPFFGQSRPQEPLSDEVVAGVMQREAELGSPVIFDETKVERAAGDIGTSALSGQVEQAQPSGDTLVEPPLLQATAKVDGQSEV